VEAVITYTVFAFGNGAARFASRGATGGFSHDSPFTFTEELAAFFGQVGAFFCPNPTAAFRGEAADTAFTAKVSTSRIVVGLAT